MDRLAYSIVKQARGTPVIADERVLRARWAEAAGSRRAGSHPGVPQERVGAGHPGPGPAHRAGLPDVPAHRPGPAAHQGPAQPGLAGRAAGHRRSWPPPARPPTCSWPTRPRTCSGRRERRATGTSSWTRPRTCTRPSGGCSARPWRRGPDDLFIAADPHQRIYDNRVSLASLRISVRGRSRRLSLNYRTTQEILAWAVPLLGSDPVTGLDGEVDSLLGYRSPMHGQRPQRTPRGHPRPRNSLFLPNGSARGWRPASSRTPSG